MLRANKKKREVTQLEAQLKKELDTLTKIIIETVPVKQIYLFGSYAYGSPHEDSDLDLYIVIEDSAQIRELDAIKLIQKAIRQQKTMSVDIVVSKAQDFNARKNLASLERLILREGVLLYG